jgi:hypothetical protein
MLSARGGKNPFFWRTAQPSGAGAGGSQLALGIHKVVIPMAMAAVLAALQATTFLRSRCDICRPVPPLMQGRHRMPSFLSPHFSPNE